MARWQDATFTGSPEFQDAQMGARRRMREPIQGAMMAGMGMMGMMPMAPPGGWTRRAVEQEAGPAMKHPQGYTVRAYELADEVPSSLTNDLMQMHQAAGQRSVVMRRMGKWQEALDEANKGQFFRELAERILNTGSAKR